jgi:hypothetical protein
MDSNVPALAMVYVAPFFEKWLCAMRWSVYWNRSSFPFMTSDNPVVMWADRGDGAELGVGFEEPALQVLFPLTPATCLMAAQTEGSLRTVIEDDPESNPQFTGSYSLTVNRGDVGIDGAVRLNQITVSNAEHYVFSSSDAENVRLFLRDLFFGLPGPVRRFDRKPLPVRISSTRKNGHWIQRT